jgi:[acyl-carrier-protein] S-malonyltransferase
MLPVSAAFHCGMMRRAAEQFAEVIAEADIRPPAIPVIQNATSQAAHSAGEMKDALVTQLCAPVDWINIAAKLSASAAAVVECGPGGVLSGLQKRITPQTRRFALKDSESLTAALAEFAAEGVN